MNAQKTDKLDCEISLTSLNKRQAVDWADRILCFFIVRRSRRLIATIWALQAQGGL